MRDWINSFLSNDSTFGKTMTKIGIIAGANLLFVIFSLPVVTLGAAWAAAESLAAAADKAIAARAQIGSPSKITTRYGKFMGMGLGNGLVGMRDYVAKRASAVTTSAISTIDNGVQRARTSMARLIGTMAPETEIRQRSGDMSLSDEYDYRSEAHYTIKVESVMDGRKVGEGVAEVVGEKIEQKAERDARKRGKT